MLKIYEDIDDMSTSELVDFLDESREVEKEICMSLYSYSTYPKEQYGDVYDPNSDLKKQFNKQKKYIDITYCSITVMDDHIIVTPYLANNYFVDEDSLDTKNTIILKFPAYIKRNGINYIVHSKKELYNCLS